VNIVPQLLSRSSGKAVHHIRPRFKPGRTANVPAATFTGFSSRDGCATGSVGDVAQPVELLS